MPRVQIAGTNGKSSTARITAALLGAEGIATGLYTSPELERYPERIEIGGAVIGDEEFALAVGAALDAARSLRGPSAVGTAARLHRVRAADRRRALALPRAGCRDRRARGRPRRPLGRDQRRVAQRRRDHRRRARPHRHSRRHARGHRGREGRHHPARLDARAGAGNRRSGGHVLRARRGGRRPRPRGAPRRRALAGRRGPDRPLLARRATRPARRHDRCRRARRARGLHGTRGGSAELPSGQRGDSASRSPRPRSAGALDADAARARSVGSDVPGALRGGLRTSRRSSSMARTTLRPPRCSRRRFARPSPAPGRCCCSACSRTRTRAASSLRSRPWSASIAVTQPESPRALPAAELAAIVEEVTGSRPTATYASIAEALTGTLPQARRPARHREPHDGGAGTAAAPRAALIEPRRDALRRGCFC